MKLCPRCGGSHDGPACPQAGSLDAVAAIEQKIRRTRFRDSPTARWAGQGARYGFGIALFLGQILAIVIFVKTASKPSWSFGQDFLFQLVSVVLGSALYGAVLGAAGAILVMGVFRPVWFSLFRSIDDWEQEYGDSSIQLARSGAQQTERRQR
jgi:hypothetical protein